MFNDRELLIADLLKGVITREEVEKKIGPLTDKKNSEEYVIKRLLMEKLKTLKEEELLYPIDVPELIDRHYDQMIH